MGENLTDIEKFQISLNDSAKDVSSRYNIIINDFHTLFNEPVYITKLARFKEEINEKIYENKISSNKLQHHLNIIKKDALIQTEGISNWKEKDIIISSIVNDIQYIKDITDSSILLLSNINRGIESLYYSINKIM